uniref:Uncharacterized protein n=1 Tax=Populus davidiana TaxID=266767 RepID=A0A6M2EV95_9ROSI
MIFFAGGKWWDHKTGFNTVHFLYLIKDSQPDFGKNLSISNKMPVPALVHGSFHPPNPAAVGFSRGPYLLITKCLPKVTLTACNEEVIGPNYPSVSPWTMLYAN